jgi:hypothetical protein
MELLMSILTVILAEIKKRQKEEEEEKKKNDPENLTAEERLERLGMLHNSSKIITFPVG